MNLKSWTPKAQIIASLLLLLSFFAQAQATWTSTCNTTTQPTLKYVRITTCGNDDTNGEYEIFQTGSAAFNVANLGLSVPQTAPVTVINGFTRTDPSNIIATLNAGVGTCATAPVFVSGNSAPYNGVIPANSYILAFNNPNATGTNVSYVLPNSISSWCGQRVYVVFGSTNLTSAIFKNLGSCSSNCVRNIKISYDATATYCETITYSYNQLPAGADVYFTFPAGGVVNQNVGNNTTCFPGNLVNCYVTANANRTLCEGDSIRIGSHVYRTGGTFIDTVPSSAACDTIFNTNIALIGRSYSIQNRTLCFGDTLRVGTHLYNRSGIYRDTIRNFRSCDSVVTTNLTVFNKVVYFTPPYTICQGDSLLLNGRVYRTAGMYTDSFRTIYGCDSLIFTTLNVTPLAINNISRTICSGDSVRIGTHWYRAPGFYRDTIHRSGLCDSVVNTVITVIFPTVTNINPSICQGGSFTVGTHTYTTAGNYIDTLRAVNLCDSIVVTRLTVNSRPNISQSRTICQGASISVGTHTYTTTGVYRDTLRTPQGCDSIINTTVTVNPTYNQTTTRTICQGDTVRIGANIYTTAGTFTNRLTTAAGCDSIITLNIIVIPKTTTNIARSLCQGDSIRIGIHVYRAAGTFSDTLRSGRGCDSIVNTTITVFNKVATNNPQTICQGQRVVVGDHFYTTSGTYTDTLRTFRGCDSVVTTVLTVGATTRSTSTPTICEGSSVTVATHTYTTTGVYLDTVRNARGCDSVITTNLNVKPKARLTIARTACDGDTIRIGTQIYTTSQTTSTTAVGFNGCDSITTLNITFNPKATVAKSYSICKGDSIRIGARFYKDTTTVTERLLTSKGCDSTTTSKITFAAPSTVTRDTIIGYTDSIRIGNRWVSTAGTYTDTLKVAGTSCIIIRTTNLKILCSPMQLPNAFTPNGDNLNDFFNGYIAKEYPNSTIKHMTIYDRWGNIVIELTDIPLNNGNGITRDNNRGWNGMTTSGTPVASDVYIYKIDVLDCTGVLQSVSGEVNLIR
jgi:gliding motility-associated-like protein